MNAKTLQSGGVASSLLIQVKPLVGGMTFSYKQEKIQMPLHRGVIDRKVGKKEYV